MSVTTAGAAAKPRPMSREEKKVIFASSLGTVFEWYDFYLYGSLAAIIGAQFFSAYPPATRDIFALLAFAAGFLVRPFGALVFGRIGDLVGRKYTFLVTILIMGLSTFIVGILPNAASIGIAAPIILIGLRLLQGLALGGEYGGAATYVAEHAPHGRRGFYTSWIQTTATLGLFLSLIVILFTRTIVGEQNFSAWGWRVPFLVSIALLGVSVWIRLQLSESPTFQKMKEEGTTSKAPLSEAFGKWGNLKVVLSALFGLVAGQGVVWYTGQFYALFFLTITLKVDGMTAYTMIGLALILGTPFFIFFGWLSDKIGRLKIILAGCLLAAITYFPLFGALTHYVNPALEQFQQKNAITVAAKDCQFHIFVGPWSKFSECDRAQDFLTKAGLSFTKVPLPAGATENVIITISNTEIRGFEAAKVSAILKEKGYPASADKNAINWPMTMLVLWIMLIYVTMVYGPIAAFLVEMFPTKIRYTSMSLPYHIGNGWFGGMLPLLATALAAASGDIYYGLWYPIIVALMTFVIGLLFLKDRKDIDLHADESAYK